ncbi:MAG: hypothetical protein BroJett025_10780 [Patescibacteria group bacterium]|nr:MAG: hypothetical protein BroJett025_10780 [Patescibacteria group bacterium]
MKKLLQIVIVFLLGFVVVGAKNQVFAIDSCTVAFNRPVAINNFKPQYGLSFVVGINALPVNAIITGLSANQQYTVSCDDQGFGWFWSEQASYQINSDSSGNASWSVPDQKCWYQEDKFRLRLKNTAVGIDCLLLEYEVLAESDAVSCTLKKVTDANGNSGCFEVEEVINWEFHVVNGDGTAYTKDVMIRTDSVYGGGVGADRIYSSPDGVLKGTDTVAGATNNIIYTLYAEADIGKPIESCTLNAGKAKADVCSEEERQSGPNAVSIEAFSLCKQIPADPEFEDQRNACLACTEGTLDEEGNKGVWTAIGCIKRDPESILKRFISVGLGMSGGVALLTFLAAGFIFSTSQGDPKAYGKAKEMMTASIVGILFVIFSVTILQFIGFEILKIPGFGGV